MLCSQSLKCRAITPLNRSGAEPYFCTQQPLPPWDAWIDSGFPIESRLRTLKAPFAYFTKATYIPFATIKNISFDVEVQLGIISIKTNIPDPELRKRHYSVSFSQPPRCLRYIHGEVSVIPQHTARYSYIQVNYAKFLIWRYPAEF